MSLSLKAIDRIFERLTMTYGRDFSSKWEGVDQNAVKSSWAHELSGFDKALHMIGWALENLPDKPPNVIQFRALCRLAPMAEAKQLEAPRADPERVKAELAKLSTFRAPGPKVLDCKQWARVILDAPKGRTPTVLKMARDALEPV